MRLTARLFLLGLCTVLLDRVSSPLLLAPGPTRALRAAADAPRRLRIGVLAHELTRNMKQSLADLVPGLPRERLLSLFHAATQVSANYAQFARVEDAEFFPVLLSDPIDLIIRQLRYLDGLLLPGGAPGFQFLEGTRNREGDLRVRLNLRRRYFRKADQVIESAKFINRTLRPFALFGICLGFEMMLLNESRFRVPLQKVENQNVNLPVRLRPDAGRFGRWAREHEPGLDAVLAAGPQFFYNSKGVSVQSFEADRRLSQNYRVLSEFESGGRRFVGAVEHRDFPFFGLQFHPEKNLFDASAYFQADHSPASQRVARLFQSYFRHLLGAPDPAVPFDPSAFAGAPATVLPELGYYKNLMVFARKPELRGVLEEAARAVAFK